MRRMNHFAALLVGAGAAVAVAGCGPSDDTVAADARVLDAAGADAPTGSDAAPPDGGGSPDAPVADAAPPDVMPGDAQIDFDIRDLQMGVVAPDTMVTVAGVVVTARADGASSTVLFVQEPSGTPQWSGIFVFVDTTPAPPFALPAVSDLVTVTGTVMEFSRAGYPGSRTNLDLVSDITIVGAAPLPAPAVVPEADLLFGAAAAEQWEGVLVRVEGVTVATRDPFGEVTLAAGLKLDDRLWAYPQPWPGDAFAAVVGPLDHDFGTSRVLPRGSADFVGYAPAPPVLVGLAPASVSIGLGTSATLTLTLDRPAPAGGTTVGLGSANPAIAAPSAPSVVVPEAATERTFAVNGVAAGGPVDVTATLGGVTLASAVTVLPSPDPVLVGITPSPASVMAGGGTGVLQVTIDRAAPAGGTLVTLAAATADVAVPASVTIPEGQTAIGFRVRGDAAAPAGPVALTATVTTGSVMGAVNVVAAAAAPAVGELVVNEVNYDPPTAGGDANCDGVVDSAADEFIELANASAGPLDLTGVSVWDAVTFATPPARFTFPAFVLGPGETVVVFAGAVGSMSVNPWCTGLTASSIGDARVFVAGSLYLNNTGETVYLTAGPMNTSTQLAAPLALPSGSDEAFVRSPDLTGAFVKHTTAPGHAPDRAFTPGTLLTGAPFAGATPL